MRSRAGTILLIIAQATFLNVIVPAHVRGIVTLAGSRPATVDGPTLAGRCCSQTTPRDGRRQPTPEAQRDCAICFVAAHLTTPPAPDLALPKLGLARVVPPPVPLRIDNPELVPTYDACGPPRLA